MRDAPASARDLGKVIEARHLIAASARALAATTASCRWSWRAVPETRVRRPGGEEEGRNGGCQPGGDKTWSKMILIAMGREVHEKQCAVCHQPEGQGMPPVFPALAGSKVVNAAAGTGHQGRWRDSQ